MFNAQENAWDAIDYGYIGPLLNTLVNKLLDYKWWWPCNLCFGLDENCLLCMHAWHGSSRFHPKILKHFCSFISVFWLLLLLFFHRHPSGWWMFPSQPRYHPTAQLHHGFLRKAVGDFVTPFVLEKLFDYSCSVEIAGSYYGHVPCKFRKVCLGLKYLPQINYRGEMTCFGCSPGIISLIWVAC